MFSWAHCAVWRGHIVLFGLCFRGPSLLFGVGTLAVDCVQLSRGRGPRPLSRKPPGLVSDELSIRSLCTSDAFSYRHRCSNLAAAHGATHRARLGASPRVLPDGLPGRNGSRARRRCGWQRMPTRRHIEHASWADAWRPRQTVRRPAIASGRHGRCRRHPQQHKHDVRSE